MIAYPCCCGGSAGEECVYCIGGEGPPSWTLNWSGLQDFWCFNCEAVIQNPMKSPAVHSAYGARIG